MGAFFCDLLSFDHNVAVLDIDPERLRFTFNVERFSKPEQVKDFKPELVINAATVKYTIDAFRSIMPYIPENCILSDIASVKTGLPEFYISCGHPFVSSHPMFGPTFASLNNLTDENAVVIKEGNCLGRTFFLDLYRRLHLNVVEYTFAEHDETMSYSLSVPFAASLAFGATIKHQDAPGTTFKRHMRILRGLMSEDDFLLSEILFNPESIEKIDTIIAGLKELRTIISTHDVSGMSRFIEHVRNNIG